MDDIKKTFGLGTCLLMVEVMGRYLLLSLGIFIVSCTSSQSIKDDSLTGRRETSQNSAIDSEPPPQQQQGFYSASYSIPQESTEGAVTVWEEDELQSDGLLKSVLSIAANPEYYKEEFISGRAYCRFSSQNEEEAPCMNLQVVLIDREGREISRVNSPDGEFVFAAQPQKTYQIKIKSDRYQVAHAPEWVAMGSDVSLHLIKK